MIKTVILDYGHGGTDPGACANGLVEKTMNLVTGEACKKELQIYKVPVVALRNTDVTMSLSERTSKANTYGKDSCYVSIHHNAGGGDRGECIYSVVANMGKELADSIGNEMLNVLGQQKKIYNKVGDYNRDYYHVIRETVMEAVIVEVCFIDNASDVQIADTIAEQERNGRVIAHGILKRMGINLNQNTPPVDSNKLYRVRKSWADASSQKSANSVLEYAKKECDKYPGYSVYDANGKAVYPVYVSPAPSAPKPPTIKEKIIEDRLEYGKGPHKCTVTKASGISFYDEPSSASKFTGSYGHTESVYYDRVITTDKYIYVSWISASTKKRRYMPTTEKSTGTKWAKCE